MISRVIFCGGGSGGHVMPALTLIEEIKTKYSQIEIEYIGSYKGIECDLVGRKKIVYHPIHTGKIRRYLSFENVVDQFRLLLGLFQAIGLMLRWSRRTTIIFSTGGFVSVPVVVAAWLTGKKVYVHEQTARIGLANKLASYFAKKFFISFEDTKKYLPAEKVVFSGYPVRDAFYHSSVHPVVINGVDLHSLSRPLIFITGGGNGSILMNDLVLKHMTWLKNNFVVLHQIGKQDYERFAGLADATYLPVQFLGDEMIDCMKLASLVVARSGAGTVCELMALKKKSIFIPLKIAQKNEQYHNAMEAKRRIGAEVIEEDQLANCDLQKLIMQLNSSERFVADDQTWEMLRAQDIILGEVFQNG